MISRILICSLSSATIDDEIPDLIRFVYQEHGYLVDPYCVCIWDLNPPKAIILLPLTQLGSIGV